MSGLEWFAAGLGLRKEETFASEQGRQLSELKQPLGSTWKCRDFSLEARRKQSRSYCRAVVRLLKNRGWRDESGKKGPL